MPTRTAQLVLFGSSYSPLLFLFGLLDTFGQGLPSVICVALAASMTVGLIAFLRTARSLATDKVELVRAKHRDNDAIAYVMTYLVPFLGHDPSGWRGRAALSLFIAVLAVLYLQSHLFYVNPLLSLMGYRLFEAETQSGRTLILISKRKYLCPGDYVEAHTLSNYVFLEAE